MEPRITMITLGVADLDLAVAFYLDGLGLPMRESPPGIAFFTTGATWLSLYGREQLAEDATVDPAGEGFRGFALAHNVRTKELVDAQILEVEAAGGRVIKAPQDTSWGGYSSYFKDPDGFLWEVAYNPFFWVE